jgi:hypothetical protein
VFPQNRQGSNTCASSASSKNEFKTGDVWSNLEALNHDKVSARSYYDL